MQNSSFQLPNSRLRSPAQRAREADGWPAKVRKLSYWKGFSACKSFQAMELVGGAVHSFNKRAKLPERAGNQVGRCGGRG
jgi:hypothetical protein